MMHITLGFIDHVLCMVVTCEGAYRAEKFIV